MQTVRVSAVVLLAFVGLAFWSPVSVFAQELVLDTVTTIKAKVLNIISQEEAIVPGTDVPHTVQTIEVEILEGDEQGKRLTLENDYLMLEVGEVFYVTHRVNEFERLNVYFVSDPYRLPALGFIGLLFVGCALYLGGRQGLRGLFSLLGSLFVIWFLLLPGVLSGYSPVLVSVGAASLIIILGSYITHGFNRTTSAAVLGMIVTIVFIGLFSHLAIEWTRLSGFESDEAMYLNLDTRGAIDFGGLLLGGMLIGLLGVLYDAAIGQAVAVEELMRAGEKMTSREVYTRARRIGREHIGALVNTLAIAYVGAALPLLLLFHSSRLPFLQIINREVFSTELVRIMAGGIGVMFAVPITTAVAVFVLTRKRGVQ